MIKCRSCGTENIDSSQYCDECGSALNNLPDGNISNFESQNFTPRNVENPIYQSANVTSLGIPAIEDKAANKKEEFEKEAKQAKIKNVYATLVIERGDAIGTEFNISAEESYIGRWDADNGIFPDVDLDAYDTEAKVSRKHARILCVDNKYSIEDLGSTNGTYINRGRRLIPGNAQVLEDGDEIIVGKTFLRFNVNS